MRLKWPVSLLLLFICSDELAGLASIMRYIARAGPAAQLYPADPLAACLVDHLVDYAATHLVAGAGLEAGKEVEEGVEKEAEEGTREELIGVIV